MPRPGRDVVVLLVVARRRPPLPAIVFGGDPHGVAVARLLEILQAKIDRIGVGRCRHLVHERLAAEQDRRAKGVAQVGRAQRRGAVHQRRNDVPAEPRVVERVGGDRNLETQIGRQRQAEEMPCQHVRGAALARVGVGARECLADVLVGDHLAGGVDADAAGVDGSGALRTGSTISESAFLGDATE
jgi:hypothetical protein